MYESNLMTPIFEENIFPLITSDIEYNKKLIEYYMNIEIISDVNIIIDNIDKIKKHNQFHSDVLGDIYFQKIFLWVKKSIDTDACILNFYLLGTNQIKTRLVKINNFFVYELTTTYYLTPNIIDDHL